MSIYEDTQELKKIFEDAPVFKAATPEQAAGRKVPSAAGLIRCIYDEMGSDDENEAQNLFDLYTRSNHAEQKLIDDVLIYLCGWTMSTLYAKSQDPKYQDEI